MNSWNEKFLHVLYLSVTTDTFNSRNLLQLIRRNKHSFEIKAPVRATSTQLCLFMPLSASFHRGGGRREECHPYRDEPVEFKWPGGADRDHGETGGASRWDSVPLRSGCIPMCVLESGGGGSKWWQFGARTWVSVKSHLSLLGLHLQPLKSVTCRNAHGDFCRIFCGRKSLGYFNRASFVHWMIIQEGG